MKKNLNQWLFFSVIAFSSQMLLAKDAIIPPVANGIQVPVGYKNWRVIGVSHRTDNNTLRAIIGNPIAINAARDGVTKPWPTGSILGKLVWKDSQHPAWDKATIPGDLSHIEFMFKDPVKYKATGGWGFARWVGMEAKPYGEDADFANECFKCHQLVQDYDYVFTKPAQLP